DGCTFASLRTTPNTTSILHSVDFYGVRMVRRCTVISLTRQGGIVMIQHLKLSFFLAIAMVAALITITEPAAAQVPTCEAPCGGDSTQWPWFYPNEPFKATIEINGCQATNSCCTVIADYKYRTVCMPHMYEIEIIGLHWDRPCNPNGFDPVPIIKTV